MIFPQKGVRFIAINDGVDSAQGENDFAPLRNIFNEWLVRDTMDRKALIFCDLLHQFLQICLDLRT